MGYTVTIEARSYAHGYVYKMHFVDKSGKEHVQGDEKSTDGKGSYLVLNTENCLRALIEAVSILKVNCVLDIRLEENNAMIVEAFTQGWVKTWVENGWKNSKGKNVRCKELWEKLVELLQKHAYKFGYIEEQKNVQARE